MIVQGLGGLLGLLRQADPRAKAEIYSGNWDLTAYGCLHRPDVRAGADLGRQRE